MWWCIKSSFFFFFSSWDKFGSSVDARNSSYNRLINSTGIYLNSKYRQSGNKGICLELRVVFVSNKSASIDKFKPSKVCLSFELHSNTFPLKPFTGSFKSSSNSINLLLRNTSLNVLELYFLKNFSDNNFPPSSSILSSKYLISIDWIIILLISTIGILEFASLNWFITYLMFWINLS